MGHSLDYYISHPYVHTYVGIFTVPGRGTSTLPDCTGTNTRLIFDLQVLPYGTGSLKNNHFFILRYGTYVGPYVELESRTKSSKVYERHERKKKEIPLY